MHPRERLDDLMDELKIAQFNSLNEVTSLLKKYSVTFDRAKDDPNSSAMTQLILGAFIQKCSEPKRNITQLTMILGEEDINLPLLKFVEKAIRAREHKEKNQSPTLTLPSLKREIAEAERMEKKQQSPHVKLGLMSKSTSSEKENPPFIPEKNNQGKKPT